MKNKNKQGKAKEGKEYRGRQGKVRGVKGRAEQCGGVCSGEAEVQEGFR